MIDYPLTTNGNLCDPVQTEAYFTRLFQHVDFEQGQLISLLGVGEKGTEREGIKPERQFSLPHAGAAIMQHIRRWAEWHLASFAVPAVIHGSAAIAGDVKLDKVALMTAIILDIDSGDIAAKAAFVTARLGKPSMTIASGGSTSEGQQRLHLYWMLDEPSDEIDRIAALRKALVAKCGGDQSFGRATQIIRIPGSVHAKHGIASVCTILDLCDADYSLDDLADVIDHMAPMEGIEQVPQLMQLSPGGMMNFAPPPMMDFTPRIDTAAAAMNRNVAAVGDELNRWGEFTKVAGLKISEARRGNISQEQAYNDVCGWALVHMVPTWPQARIEQEYRRLLEKDAATHGTFPMVAQESDMTALPVEFFGDIQPSLLNSWLVRDFIPQQSLALFYGNPGSGKSFLALDIALRVAAGIEVDGRAVKQCPTVYLAAEGQGGFRRRVAAFRDHYKLDPNTPFALIPTAINLLDPKADLPRLVAAIKQASERLGGPPGLIIVDTLAATFGGGDENTSAMVGYINNLAYLRDAFNATAAVVHHRPKDQLNKTPRGHGSLSGAMDVVFCVEGGDVHSATITKQKDAEAGAPLCFSLESINLGADEEGEPVNSAIVKYLAPKVEVNLSPQTLKVWRALRDAIAARSGSEDGGVDSEPANLSITKLQWRDYWMLLGVTDEKEEARSKAFNRAFKALQAAGKVRQSGEQWFVVEDQHDLQVAATSPVVMDFLPRYLGLCTDAL